MFGKFDNMLTSFLFLMTSILSEWGSFFTSCYYHSTLLISTIFTDWLNARGGDGSIEVKHAIAHIEHLLVTNELSDRVHDLRDGDSQTVRNLLAYRKVDREGDTEEFWVPSQYSRESSVMA